MDGADRASLAGQPCRPADRQKPPGTGGFLAVRYHARSAYTRSGAPAGSWQHPEGLANELVDAPSSKPVGMLRQRLSSSCTPTVTVSKKLTAVIESCTARRPSMPGPRPMDPGPEGLGPQAEKGSRSEGARSGRAASLFIVYHPFIAGFSMNDIQ